MPVSSTVWCAPVSRSPWRVDVEVEARRGGPAGRACGRRTRRRCARSPAPVPSSARRRRMSVSPVVRSISALRRHDDAPFWRASIDSAWTVKPSARATGAPARASGAGGAVDVHLGHAPAEVARRQRRTRSGPRRRSAARGWSRRRSRRTRCRWRRRRAACRRCAPAGARASARAPTSCRCSGANALASASAASVSARRDQRQRREVDLRALGGQLGGARADRLQRVAVVG